jgi:clan AA aspartic protease (TIGR02281 family)
MARLLLLARKMSHKTACVVTLAVVIYGCSSAAPVVHNDKSGPHQVENEATRQAQDALAHREFERIHDIFDQQCTFKEGLDTLDAQIKCTVAKYRGSGSPATTAGSDASLRLFDSVYSRFTSYYNSRDAMNARVQFSQLLRRVQRVLDEGTQVNAPLDEIMQGASIVGARESPGGPSARPLGAGAIQLRRDGGTYIIAAEINGRITLDFTLDSGASDVTIPADVALTLMRTGTLTEQDFVDRQTYQLADGSTLPSQRVRIRSLKVGSIEMHDVVASVVPARASLLLGQSFLGRLKSWTIDNSRPALIASQ